MIQDPQTMEIEEIIPDVMAEMVRMDKDAMGNGQGGQRREGGYGQRDGQRRGGNNQGGYGQRRDGKRSGRYGQRDVRDVTETVQGG